MKSIGMAFSKREFLRRIYSVSARFRKDNASGALNTLLAEEDAPLAVVQGYVLESYHYIKAAPQHIGTAYTHCSDNRLKSILLELLLEEQGHEKLMLKTLKCLGFKERNVTRSCPTIGTLALISLLSDLGRKNSLAYIACTSLNEATEEDVESEERSFRFFVEKYGLPKNAFEGLLMHSKEDLQSGHVCLIERSLQGLATIPIKDADAVIASMYDIGRAYKQFNDCIADYYSKPGCRIPRRSGQAGLFD